MSSFLPCMCFIGPGGFQGHPMSPNTVPLSYDNSSAHSIFICHIGSRWSNRDCLVSSHSLFQVCLLRSFRISGPTSSYLDTQLYAHLRLLCFVCHRLQYHICHARSLSCQFSCASCFIVHQCEFIQSTSKHICPAPFVFWRYRTGVCKASVECFHLVQL